jgi:anti-sigma factor RsiW
MSTCPDSDLYSAYTDGEVPSPWKEKLEAHIASCPACQRRAGRYTALHAIISGSIAATPDIDLESSYARLCSRRSQIIATVGKRANVKIPEWIHFSVRMPLPAFAAVLVAAIIIPALFVLKTTGTIRSQHEQFSLIQQDVNTLKTLASTHQIYSPDLSMKAIPARSIATSDRNTFEMVSFARQFASDESLFSGSNIIIIKLPKLTRFSDAEEIFQENDVPLLQAAGYTK